MAACVKNKERNKLHAEDYFCNPVHFSSAFHKEGGDEVIFKFKSILKLHFM